MPHTLDMQKINDYVDNLISKSIIKDAYLTIKTTAVCLTLPNGFEVVGTSHAANKHSYDQAIGKQCCMDEIRNKLIEFEIYRRLHKKEKQLCNVNLM